MLTATTDPPSTNLHPPPRRILPPRPPTYSHLRFSQPLELPLRCSLSNNNNSPTFTPPNTRLLLLLPIPHHHLSTHPQHHQVRPHRPLPSPHPAHLHRHPLRVLVLSGVSSNGSPRRLYHPHHASRLTIHRPPFFRLEGDHDESMPRSSPVRGSRR